MGGGIFQINIKGKQDIKLVGNPQVNFLKQQYLQHVNFSSEFVKLEPRETANFGRKFTFKFKNTADMLHQIYFCFSLPVLTPTSGTYAGWTNSIGHAIIDNIELSVAGDVIDKKTGLFMELWHELTTKGTLGSSDDKMIGKFKHTQLLQYNAETATNYMVFIPFWFCKDLSSSFPLIALYFQELTITITLKNFDECIVYDGTTLPNNVDMYDVYLLAENIYLGEKERLITRNSSHKYIINQTQYSEPRSIGLSGFSHNPLSFNHPVYELIFVIRETLSDDNNDWFNFAIRNNIVNTEIIEFIESANLITDGIEKTKEMTPSHVLNILNCKRYHTNTTDKFIYLFSFCNNPESNYQPSGFLNFSSIDTVDLVMKIKNTIPAANLHVFALNWNFIEIDDGRLYLEFFT